MAGVVSFQLVDLPALIAKLPATQGKPLPLPMATIRLYRTDTGSESGSISSRCESPSGETTAPSHPAPSSSAWNFRGGDCGPGDDRLLAAVETLFVSFVCPECSRAQPHATSGDANPLRWNYRGIAPPMGLHDLSNLGGVEGTAEGERCPTSCYCGERRRLFRSGLRCRSSSHRHHVKRIVEPSSHHLCRLR